MKQPPALANKYSVEEDIVRGKNTWFKLSKCSNNGLVEVLLEHKGRELKSPRNSRKIFLVDMIF